MTEDPFHERAARSYGNAYQSVRIRVGRSGPLYAAAILLGLAVAILLLLPLILLVFIVTAVVLALLWLKRLVLSATTNPGGSPRAEGRQNVRVIRPPDE